MLARSGLVGKNSSRPHLGPFEAIFSMGRKNTKIEGILPISLGGPMGPIHPVWGNGCNIFSAYRMSQIQAGSCKTLQDLKSCLRIQRMMKHKTGGQGLNGWPRTQRVVNPFSGNLEDGNDTVDGKYFWSDLV